VCACHEEAVVGFLDDVKVEAVRSVKVQNVCSVAKWLDTADAEEAAEFNEALANDLYAATVIFKVLRQRGAEGVSVHAGRRHRRLECECTPRAAVLKP
jgi:hypothetical protein